MKTERLYGVIGEKEIFDIEYDEEVTITSLAIKAVFTSDVKIPAGYQSKTLKAFFSTNIGFLSNE